jgi:aminoglycoside 6'-N-acetyltransferase I
MQPMESQTQIRRATAADQPRWMELRHALWSDCPTARHALEMEQLLNSEGVVLLAISPLEEAVGLAEVSIRRDHVEGTSSAPVAYLEGWYVAPAYRQQGVGHALIRAAEEWALRTGFSELASDAEADNRASISAHLAIGFREVGRSVHFVRSLRRDHGSIRHSPVENLDEKPEHHPR